VAARSGSATQARLRAALTDALRGQDRVAVSALRSALSAIGNAEAVSPLPDQAGPSSSYFGGARLGSARRLRAEAEVLRRMAADHRY
jgi:uncharacterized protein